MSTPERSTPDRELEPAEALRAELEAQLEAETGVLEAEPELDAGSNPDAGGDGADEVDDGPVGEAVDAVDNGADDTGEPELTIALSPRQILGGFALLAAIVIWLFRRRKK